MIIAQVQNESLVCWSHNIPKSSLGFAQKISLSGGVGIIDFDTHGLALFKEILGGESAIPVGVEGIVLLFGWSDELHFAVETGLEVEFEDGIGLGKDVRVFEISSVEAKLNLKRIGVFLG